ncbi:MAG: PD40 domain-containing protein [Bacteroidales bacterium]|nr:PD40 domain-containing protein [Bacteroidales bacterium]
MKKIVLTAILVTAFIAVHVIPSQAQSPEQLYQKGLIKEEGEGSLQEAITLFSKVADNTKADQSLRAKALLHAGMCYEKMGKQEATKTYQRLVNNFPSQKNEVAIARERLSRLILMTESIPEVPLKPDFTKVKMPGNPGNGMLSPDGKKIAFITEGDVWVIPVSGGVNPYITGEPKRLTRNIGAWDNMINSFCWSGNGKWIAFNAELGKMTSSTSIYVIPSEGGDAQKVKVPSHICGWPSEFRLSLSPDGKILAYASGWLDYNARTTQIYTIPVNGNEAKELTEPGTWDPAWSPDGSRIAFVKFSRDNERNEYSELLVIPAQGGTPKKLIDRQLGQIRGPVWSPDGKMIAYIKRPAMEDPKEIWLVQLTNEGDPVGTPLKVDLPLESFHTIAGWTPDNKIGVQLTNPEYEIIYTVPAAGGIATQVTPQGWVSYPKWSPDGKRIYFRWDGGKIASVPSEGGAVDSIQLDSEFVTGTAVPGSGNEISPDGKTIVFAGMKNFYEGDKKNWEVDIFTVPVEGGKPKQLTSISNDLQDRFPCWSPNGNSIAFIRPEIIDKKYFMHIYTISRDGENLRRITDKSDSVAWAPLDWTQDGKSITFFSMDNEIRSIPAEGGESNLITEIDSANSQFDLAWSPDGKELAYTDKGKIWIFTPGSGITKEVKTGVSVPATKLSWSPDGEKIAFTAFAGGDNDFWFMENFLPLERLAQKAVASASRISEDITVRQIWSGQETDDFGSTSADGSLLSFTEWESGNLAVRNMKTGENKLVTNDATWLDSIQYAEYSLISHDGKQFAYTWYYKNLNYQLRLIKSDGKKALVLYSCKGWDEYITPGVWFADAGKIIAQKSDSKTRSTQLISVNTSSGEIEVLKEITAEYPSLANLALSPGETYLAYDFPDPSNNGMFDIHVISLGTKQETAVVEHPANDRLLGWLPGRNEMLFVSDRSGTKDLWALNVSDGKPSGVPRRILKNTGDIDPMGFTKQGSLLFGLSTTSFESFIVPLNSGNGEVAINERTPVSGQRTGCTWLPDGESLIFTEYIQESAERTRKNLVIMNAGIGESRILAENLFVTGQFGISPDGRSAVALGLDQQRLNEKDYSGAIYLIDIETGSMTEVKTGHDVTRAMSCEWDKDGKNIFYFSNSDLVKHNLETGDEKVIYSVHKIYYTTMIRSHDGDNLLFHVPVDMNNDKFHLLSVPVNGGDADTLATYQAFGSTRFSRMALSPDGEYIYLTSRAPGVKSILSRIPSTGGTPENLWQSTYYFLTGISVHPDGKKIAISTFETAREIRVIENLAKKIAETFNEKEQIK